MKARFCFAAAVCVATVFGCIGKSGTAAALRGGEVELRVSAEKGVRYTSELSMEMNIHVSRDSKMSPNEVKMLSGNQSMTLSAVTESELIGVSDGKYTWVDTVTEIKADGKGLLAPLAVQMNQLKGHRTTVVMDSLGKILSQKTEGGPSGAPQGGAGQVEGFGFPSTPVKVGGSWESKVNSNGQDMTVKCVVTEITADVVRLDATMSGVEGLKMSGPLKVELDRVTGRPNSTIGTMLIDQGGALLTLKLSMKKK